MTLFMAFLDMIGIASIMPFLSVLVNPEVIDSNFALKSFFEISNRIGIETKKQFLIFLGILCFITLVISIIFKALTVYFQLSFNARCRHITAKQLMRIYLQQPYGWFLNRHSADLGKSILSEVSVLIDRGLGSVINIITQSTISIVMLLLLLFIDYKLTILVGCSLGLIYGSILKLIKNYTSKLGKERLIATEKCFTTLIETFSAFKVIKVAGLENVFINRFSNPSHILSRHSATIEMIAKMPRLIIEVLIFGSIILLVLYLMIKNSSLLSVLPIISIYILAFYRLMPAIQGIYNSVIQVIFSKPSIDSIYNEFKNAGLKINYKSDQGSISLNKTIKLKNIQFKYPNSSRIILNNVNIEIPAFSSVALIGKTGSGKSTIVDIILGLLEPEKGILEVDGIKISRNNYRSWQKKIGYVSQQITLVDDSISSNIAFGVDPEYVDKAKIEKAAKIANIHEFIISELPLKYETIIGEQGVRLSGGQRQRIGIARALYYSPQVLILDEATSALDSLTEKMVMEEINKLKNKTTTIVIAHRLSTIKKCDKVILLEDGEIKKYGKIEEIMEDSFDKLGSRA